MHWYGHYSESLFVCQRTPGNKTNLRLCAAIIVFYHISIAVWITPLRGEVRQIVVIIVIICDAWKFSCGHISGHGVGAFWSCASETLTGAFHMPLG